MHGLEDFDLYESASKNFTKSSSTIKLRICIRNCTFNIVFKTNKCIFKGHRVTNVSLVSCSFVEKSGTLRAHIGHMMIFNQTPTNKLHLSVMKI